MGACPLKFIISCKSRMFKLYLGYEQFWCSNIWVRRWINVDLYYFNDDVIVTYVFCYCWASNVQASETIVNLWLIPFTFYCDSYTHMCLAYEHTRFLHCVKGCSLFDMLLEHHDSLPNHNRGWRAPHLQCATWFWTMLGPQFCDQLNHIFLKNI